jgi:dihydropyrimidinase
VVGAPLYIVHLSAARGLSEIHHARNAFSTHIYVETCPHYLTHTVESSVGSLGKVNPPLRSSADRDALWEGLRDGTIDTVGSDHVGRPRSAKEADIWKASAGMPGMASILSVLLSEGVHKRGLTLEQVVRLTSANAARIFGLYPKKGTISPGSDADVVLVDLGEERAVDADTWKGGSGYTLYEGWTLRGWPVMTMSRGEIVAGRGASGDHYGHGQYVRDDAKIAAGAREGSAE